MASACSKTRNCAEKRRSGGPPGSRVMAEAIALYFSYAEPQYAKKDPLFASPGPEAFFAHIARLECTYRASTCKRRSVRFAAAEQAETTAQFTAFLDFLVTPHSNRLSDRVLQALLIAERALAGYVYLLGKDDTDDWPRSHLIQPLSWFLKLLPPADAHEKILGSELKHVAELIVGISETDRRPKKIFQAIEKLQGAQTFEAFRKLIG
jgi:hypothetical protein